MRLVLQAGALAVALGLVASPADAQRLNSSAEGAYGRVTLNTGFEPDPYTVTVTAGGPIDASSVAPDCVGGLPERPSFTLNYRSGDTLPLIISATSDGDTTLAVRAPGGAWSCNDDSDDLHPAVRFDHPREGRYQIFVGSYDADATLPALLYISEVVTGGAAIAAREQQEELARPDPTLDPAYGSLDLTAGFRPDPRTRAIQAGGDLDASTLRSGCVGWIARAPDYRVNYTAGNGGRPLIFSVSSAADTTLVINDPGGNWVCDDDDGEEGLNPAIRFNRPASGQYDVWDGTFAEGEPQPSTLYISERTSR